MGKIFGPGGSINSHLSSTDGTRMVDSRLYGMSRDEISLYRNFFEIELSDNGGVHQNQVYSSEMLRVKTTINNIRRKAVTDQTFLRQCTRDTLLHAMSKLTRNVVVVQHDKITMAYAAQGGVTMGFSEKMWPWKGLIQSLKEFIQKYAAPRSCVSVILPSLTHEVIG